MNPDLFLADLEAKPAVLGRLATALSGADPWAGTPVRGADRIVLVGMGSSHYANAVAAARLRARGISAIAELASTDLLPAVDSTSVVIAVSASGGSAETLDAVARYGDRCPVIAMTNVDDSAVTGGASAVVHMLAEPEAGGVACRSYQHTLALLLALEAHLGAETDAPGIVRRSAEASADLLESRGRWLPDFLDAAIGPDGTHLAAPARRLCSAQQGALMLREVPRLPAVGCETGDWSHVDVYLTKTTDYRLVLFGGSRWEPELLRWVTERGSTLVPVGADLPGASTTVRYRHDDDDDVRLLTEVLVPELAAAALWQRAG